MRWNMKLIGDVRVRRSLCLIPFEFNGVWYWLHKITKYYKYSFDYQFRIRTWRIFAVENGWKK